MKDNFRIVLAALIAALSLFRAVPVHAAPLQTGNLMCGRNIANAGVNDFGGTFNGTQVTFPLTPKNATEVAKKFDVGGEAITPVGNNLINKFGAKISPLDYGVQVVIETASREFLCDDGDPPNPPLSGGEADATDESWKLGWPEDNAGIIIGIIFVVIIFVVGVTMLGRRQTSTA